LFILGGVAGERYGRNRTLLVGILGFTVASVLAALAPNPGWLIAARRSKRCSPRSSCP
jgi:DHA2 family multidrug resistance protein-like MFS transporter